MTTMTLTRPRGDNRLHNADYLLGMPATTEDAEALEQDRARRIVQRIAGQDAAELLDMLGLALPEATVPDEPVATKRCSRCRDPKPKTDFTRCTKTHDGLYPQCRDCRNAVRRAHYAQKGYRGMPHGDGDIDWPTAPRAGLGVPSSQAAVEARINTWADLRTEQKLEPRKAAERMAISMRTARRYDRILKDRGLLPQTDDAGQVAN